MPSPRTTGHDAILDAAAVLMDGRGVDNVSLSEINRASGNRNRSAVTYHFGSRDAIVRQLAERTMTTIDAERNTLLDYLESTREALTERDVVEVITVPLTRQLATPEGRRYLRLTGQLINHPRYNADARELLAVNTSIQRCAARLADALGHLPPAIRAERASQVTGFLVRACADQARLIDADPPPRPPLDPAAFTANLVDLLLAMMHAPSTAATAGPGAA